MESEVMPSEWVDLQDETISLVAEGWTLTKIAQSPGIGGSLKDIISWCKQDKEFQKRLGEALKFRAMILHEQAIDSARIAQKDTATSEKLRVDTFKWSASLADPEKFSPKTKAPEHEGPVIIVTGIVRDDNEEIEVIPEPDKGEIVVEDDNIDGLLAEALSGGLTSLT